MMAQKNQLPRLLTEEETYRCVLFLKKSEDLNNRANQYESTGDTFIRGVCSG